MNTPNFNLINEAYENIISVGSSEYSYEVIDEKFLNSLNEFDRNYVINAVRTINQAWMIYTSDHLFELERDSALYNEIAEAFNEKHGHTFELYPMKSHIEWRHLFPEGSKIPFKIINSIY